jgi:toxin ParE1/3/4
LNSVFVRPEATRDVARAADWYEAQRVNLGIEFVLEVDAAIDRAAESPQHYAAIYHQIRRVMLHRFPYIVYFLWRDSQIEILAVLHQYRAAGAWKARLS